MTIRTVVTVALAAAILAASLPAVERARVQQADARVAGELERLEQVARALVATNDPVTEGTPARQRVTLHLPVRSWGSAGLELFRVPPPGPGPDPEVTWQVRGGRPHARQLPRIRLAGPSDGLTIGDGGRQRVVLELRTLDERPAVVVRRPLGSP